MKQIVGSPNTPENNWHDTFNQVSATPWRYGYLSLMRRFGAQYQLQMKIGHAVRPQQEPFRLGQSPSLIFAPCEIAHASLTSSGKFQIQLFGLGLWGANGPLPIHYTEIALSRRDSNRDTTLVDFADLFHHRYLTQFYSAWQSAQSAGGGLDRRESESFSFFVASLSGQSLEEIADSTLSSHPRLAAGAHLVREARNPDGITSTLSHYFGVPFNLQEYVLHWIPVAPEEHTQLGVPGPASVIGEGALVGQMVADRQHKFRLIIGPLNLDNYLHFLPNGRDLPKLIEWVRAFVGYEYEWEIQLQLNPHSAPPAQIGSCQRLGWTTWLGQSMNDLPVIGITYEPEQYASIRQL
jgi:type VI secretion system protein ImpH